MRHGSTVAFECAYTNSAVPINVPKDHECRATLLEGRVAKTKSVNYSILGKRLRRTCVSSTIKDDEKMAIDDFRSRQQERTW